MVREDAIYDETTKAQQPEPHALQRLVRWSTMHPKEVFLRGFEPRYKTNDITNDEAFHLEYYTSLASRDGKRRIWRPRSFVDTEFAYDVCQPRYTQKPIQRREGDFLSWGNLLPIHPLRTAVFRWSSRRRLVEYTV